LTAIRDLGQRRLCIARRRGAAGGRSGSSIRSGIVTPHQRQFAGGLAGTLDIPRDHGNEIAPHHQLHQALSLYHRVFVNRHQSPAGEKPIPQAIIRRSDNFGV
jgi:hypothetical protein